MSTEGEICNCSADSVIFEETQHLNELHTTVISEPPPTPHYHTSIPVGAVIFTLTSVAVKGSVEELVFINIDWKVQGYENQTI